MAVVKNLRFVIVLLPWLSVVSLMSYFSIDGTRSNIFGKRQTVSTSVTSRPAYQGPRPPTNSFSLNSDNDGIPDAAELSSFRDRENFKRTFTGIAEMQFYRINDQWNGEQRDCAGLVRFAWREAVRSHDRAWFQKMGPGYEVFAAMGPRIISIEARSERNSSAPILELTKPLISRRQNSQNSLTRAH